MRRASLAVLLMACAPTEHGDVALGFASGELRPDQPSGSEPLFRFDEGDTVEQYDDAQGNLRVHFSRAGNHAVEAGAAPAEGVPDDVVSVVELYGAVLEHQRALGFR